MSYLSPEELAAAGFRAVGRDVRVSRRASIHGASRIALGDRVRIDDFCILSAGDGGIAIGSNVHVACYSSLIGRGTITLADFVNVSSRVSIYSSSDDYSGATMTNPTVPEEFTGVKHAPVTLGRHAIIGAGSVILPGVTLGDGVAVGALSLVSRDVPPWTVVGGNPLRMLKPRRQDLLVLEKRYLESIGN